MEVSTLGFILAIIELNFAAIELPDLTQLRVYTKGDLTLGVLAGMTYTSITQPLCFNKDVSLSNVVRIEGIRHLLAEINSRADLLPNITLGVVAYDDCGRDVGTLAQSVYMVPDVHQPSCQSRVTRRGYQHDKVVGVLGISTSRQAVLATSFLGNYKIPAVSTYATSDELVDRTRFPYLVRMKPPDSFQSKAVIELLKLYGWKHVSVLYTEGSYGEYGAKVMLQRIRSSDMCVAMEKQFSSLDGIPEVEKVLRGLYQSYPFARVVIVITESLQTSAINRVIRDTEEFHGHFHFIGFDGFGAYYKELIGTIEIDFLRSKDQAFVDYFRSSKVDKFRDNPWLLREWADRVKCSWNTKNESARCYGNETLDRMTADRRYAVYPVRHYGS